jgi:DNA-directed RNA polymerase subunit M/transcription elongation factor TFIIS
MNICPECNNRIYQYQDGDWLEWICWRCGHYESNTPAFKSVPYLFRHLVRNNPIQFLEKIRAL